MVNRQIWEPPIIAQSYTHGLSTRVWLNDLPKMQMNNRNKPTPLPPNKKNIKWIEMK